MSDRGRNRKIALQRKRFLGQRRRKRTVPLSKIPTPDDSVTHVVFNMLLQIQTLNSTLRTYIINIILHHLDNSLLYDCVFNSLLITYSTVIHTMDARMSRNFSGDAAVTFVLRSESGPLSDAPDDVLLSGISGLE
ncbi:hypothetical protein EYF80_021730 [Liparis tanakae]|uniref:Uncharacterized protein n=1 Tax=Liparis tanakae TaxID=230148 RepID=A0A4Z2HRZ5_9TELE|nr:hypothetical protein EYF80_021730 [Liparis tanakae]